MKGMKFALVVISVIAMGLASANAVLYEADFESPDYTTGSVVGQDGWLGWNSPNAVVSSSSIEGQFMPGFQWLMVGQIGSSVGRNTSALYRPFDAQTGLVHLEVFYMGHQSESSWRSISLRDSSEDNAPIAALVGSSKRYGEGTPEDPREPLFFATDADGRQWDFGSTGFVKENSYKIVIDANIATQTYNATVNLVDIDSLVVGAEVASWFNLSFADTVSDISRVYVQSWDSASSWDHFLIEPGTPPVEIPGDVDGSGYVDGADRDLIIANWGKSPATRGEGDLNSDNAVTGLDYTEVITYWNTGTPEPGEAIPEPATICLLALAGTVLLARRRRQST